jgi:DNA ligase (NAD+)
MTELECKVLKYQQAYYDGEPLISDDDFDVLWDKLKAQQPDSEVLKAVGSDSSIFPKAKHLMMMGSQQKCKNEIEFKKWFKKQNENLMVVQYKLDGASLELQYQKGKLIRAITRGNGEIGDDITPNVLKMKNVPKSILGFSGAVRGEVLLFKSTLKKHFPSMANCRNGATGTMKQKSGIGCEHLNVICYDVFGKDFDLESEKQEWLQAQGFEVAHYEMVNSAEKIVKLRNTINNEIREHLDYDIDGLVIKCNTVDDSDLKRARPEHQTAFKFQLDKYETILKDIAWEQNGKRFTPVAIVEPVEIAGATVRRASLANLDRVNDLISEGMKIGSKVELTRRGEIIPYLENVLD